jgi:hypothetical protein
VPGLSFVTLLAYDYRYAFDAVRSYYDIADEIVLGLDRDRITYAGNPFTIDMGEVRDFIGGIDHANKVRIIEGDFHSLPTPMGNETHERNVLSGHCAPGNWVVQIDADEQLVDAMQFRQWMQATPPDVQVKAHWIYVFKTFGHQVLAIDPARETCPIATMRRGAYTLARCTSDKPLLSPLLLLHYGMGRTPEEVRMKLNNWSHAKDIDVDALYRLWESVTLENYQTFRDFHPTIRGAWESLLLATIRLQPSA